MTLEVLKADVLRDATHGFFTRRGGASSGIYTSLNCGQGSSDQSDIVATNRARVAGALGLDGHELLSLHQVHSDIVHTVTAPWHDRPKGDAMVTRVPGLALGVLTADCAPVLFLDPVSRVIGAAHAGWKGAIGGILEATVDAMVALGATSDDIKAIVGPSISQRAYEVGPEFVERFLDEDPDYGRFFAGGAGDRAMFDLPQFCTYRLSERGVSCDWTGHCTYSDPERFFSYRRSCHAEENDYGRLIAAIRL